MPKRAALDSYLERHGRRFRVVVTVPPSAWERVGKKKLRESLPPGITLKQADALKGTIVSKLKATIRAAHKPRNVGVTAEAMERRERYLDERPDVVTLDDGFDVVTPEADRIVERAEEIAVQKGEDAAIAFADLAFGRATPLTAYTDRMFERGRYSPAYRAQIVRALERLQDWCEQQGRRPTIESITATIAEEYVHQQFVRPKVHYRTANKDVTALSSYWKNAVNRFLGRRQNPWADAPLDKPKGNGGGPAPVKRAFTPEEVVTLLRGLSLRRDWDASLIAALSGMRQEEIIELRVRDCANGLFDVREAKTAAGVRKVPVHPDLVEIVRRRCTKKQADAYLFDELPTSKEDDQRGRAAALSQSFTRERRRLGVDERIGEHRQSNIDFHSWRRWFIRAARDALNNGASGFDPWTIAAVVGHRTEDGKLEGVPLPLGMTMGRYAGAAEAAAKRACVEAVRLPPGAHLRRDDLSQRRRGGRPRKPKPKRADDSGAQRATDAAGA
jgi:integrase